MWAAGRGTGARSRPAWVSLALLIFFVAAAARAATPEEAAYEEALATFRRGDARAAQAKIDEALRHFARSDADAVWSLRVLRGEVLNQVANCTEATRYINGVQLPPRLKTSDVAVRRLLALASAESHCRQSASMARTLAAADRLARTHRRELLADVLFRKGDLEITGGVHQAAERDLREAIALAPPPRVEARAWAAMARLRGQQQRYDEAIDASRRALTIAETLGDQVLARVVRGNLGWLYVETGDYDQAVEILSAADAENARLGRKADRVPNLLQLGNAFFAQEQYERAASYYEQAVALARELNSPMLEFCLAGLARAEIGKQNFPAAQLHNEEALQLKRNPEDKLRSLLISARIAQKLSRDDEAEQLYKRIEKEAQSRSLRWETQVFHGMFYADRGNRQRAAHEFSLALESAEAARKDLHTDELKLSFPATLSVFYNAYINLLVTLGRPEEALAVAETSRARALAEGLEVGKQRDPRQIAKTREAAILSYWLEPAKSYLWVSTPSSLKIFELPPEPEITAAVEAYQRDLAGPRGTLDASGARGAQLWSMLVAPASALIAPARQIIIIPDKRLYALNFETLVVPAPQPHYWIEDSTISTASSLQLLSRGEHAPAGGRSILLIGNPQQSDPSFPPLRLASAEMDQVRAHFRDAAVYDGARATPNAYVGSAPRHFGFIHFVAHGVAAQLQPLDSAVVLARDNAGYKLYAREIVRHPLNARLVTISSCHGAGRRTYAGEGLVGLAWAFLRAGAHQVIAALWEVNDSATPDLMDAMYAAIQSGDAPDRALRKAKLKLLHSDSVYRRPLYWAPFVLYSGA